MSLPPTFLEGALVRLGRLLNVSLRNLGASPTPEQLEAIAVLVHEAMSGRGRSFHSLGHVFDLATGPNPYVALGAIFHDVVYLQVDDGLSPGVDGLLRGAFERSGDAVRLTPATGDRLRSLAMAVFGMAPGVPIAPTAGLNEFLSALLAVRALGKLLPEPALLRVAAAIEATIPFRGSEHEEAMRARLEQVAAEHGVAMSPADLDAAVRDGVELGNKDVANFAYPDPAMFLDNTWALLPETNWSLRMKSVYSVRDYRTAMQRMEGFLSRLDGGRVFHSFRGRPAPAAFAEQVALARRNVGLGARYLGAKLVAACVLDALAERTGGAAPVALLMGDLPTEHEEPVRMERFLPAYEAPVGGGDEVFRLLHEGRASKSGFDLKNAPLAAYLYATLGERHSEAVENSRAYAAGEVGAAEFLQAFPGPIIAAVARACGQVAFFRQERLEALARELAAR